MAENWGGGVGNVSGYESICQFEFLTPLFTYESWLSKFFLTSSKNSIFSLATWKDVPSCCNLSENELETYFHNGFSKITSDGP